MAPSTSVSNACLKNGVSHLFGSVNASMGLANYNSVRPSSLPRSVTASSQFAPTSSPLSTSSVPTTDSSSSARRGATSGPSSPAAPLPNNSGRRGAISGQGSPATPWPINSGRRGAVSGISPSPSPAASAPQVAGPESQAYFADPAGASYHPSVLCVRNTHDGGTMRFNITGGMGISAHVGPVQRCALASGHRVLAREVMPVYSGSKQMAPGSPLATVQEADEEC